MSALPPSWSSFNTDAIPPPLVTSPSTSASPPPSALLECYPSRHRHEKKQGSVQLTVTIPENKHTHSSWTKGVDADQEHDEGASNGNSGFRKVAGPRAQVEAPCPPSLAALFHPHLTSEEDVGSLRFSTQEQQHPKMHRHIRTSSSSSPVDTGVPVKLDVLSDPHNTLLATPASASASASVSALAPEPAHTPTRTPTSKHPSPLTRKPSACKSLSGTGGNEAAPKSHNAKSKNMGLVDEVFGVGFVAGRARERSGTPIPIPPPRSATQHPVPSRSSTPHPQECGRRKEMGWSGEWNRGDMEEVVKGLRELKMR